MSDEKKKKVELKDGEVALEKNVTVYRGGKVFRDKCPGWIARGEASPKQEEKKPTQAKKGK